MKSTFRRLLIIYVLIFYFYPSKAQTVPPDVAALVNMKLDEGQSKLAGMGYEICSSSFTGKKQDWFNESAQTCVTIKIGKNNEISEINLNPATADCQKKLTASRKTWEKYHDGQSPVSSPKIEEERKKLAGLGYEVSYWIDEVSPGRCSEYWINESSKKTMFIVWEISGTKWVMTQSTDYKMGHNPAPKKS